MERQWTETVFKEAKAQDSLDKDFISILLDVIKGLEKTIDKKVRETRLIIYKQIEYIRKKRKQLEKGNRKS